MRVCSLCTANPYLWLNSTASPICASCCCIFGQDLFNITRSVIGLGVWIKWGATSGVHMNILKKPEAVRSPQQPSWLWDLNLHLQLTWAIEMVGHRQLTLEKPCVLKTSIFTRILLRNGIGMRRRKLWLQQIYTEGLRNQNALTSRHQQRCENFAIPGFGSKSLWDIDE